MIFASEISICKAKSILEQPGLCLDDHVDIKSLLALYFIINLESIPSASTKFKSSNISGECIVKEN